MKVKYMRGLLKGNNTNNQSFTIRERAGIEAEKYVSKPLECINEVLTFGFLESDTPEKQVPNSFQIGKYLWSHSGYKFIPELLEMIEGHEDEKDYDEDEYDRVAGDLFYKWGVCGLGLDPD